MHEQPNAGTPKTRTFWAVVGLAVVLIGVYAYNENQERALEG